MSGLTGSETLPVLTVPESVMALNYIDPGCGSAASDIACLLYQMIATLSERLALGTYVAQQVSALVTAEEGVLTRLDSAPNARSDGRLNIT